MAQPFRMIGKVLKKRSDEFTVSAGKVARRCASVVGEDLARETPVDTGTARSNWIMALDQIPSYTIPAYAPYLKTSTGDYGRRKNERAAGAQHVLGTGDKEEQTNLVAVLSQHFVTLQYYDPAKNGTIYIANNLPYIEKLNTGYSPQTPAGFVERAVEKGIAAIRGMKLMAA